MNEQVEEKLSLITLVGPPNSGKTTLFNYLSGQNFKTVNYPGATVEYSICKLLGKFNLNANILDSPGIISLIPNSPDEKVAVESLYNHPQLGIPDLIIITVDASQISRHLFLVKQLIEANFTVLIALTMTDMLQKKGLSISEKELSEELGCPVVKVDGRSGFGVDHLMAEVEKLIEREQTEIAKQPVVFDENIDKSRLIKIYAEIAEIEKKVIHQTIPANKIEKANRKLKIFSDPRGKQNCNSLDYTTLKIDKLLLHKVWGLVFFFIIMAGTFTSIFWLAQPIMHSIDSLFELLANEANDLIGIHWIGDLVSNGIITGMGSVLVFIPQITILFLILGVMEDTGYLARGAMLIDKPLSKIGLNGKSFVPMLSGFACAIPAMLAARTINNKKERYLTIFIIPLMSCSARIPVYLLLIAFLFPADKAWIGGLMLAGIYIFSIASSVIIAGFINKFSGSLIKANDNSSFILELPSYRVPKLRVVLTNTYYSVKVYLKKAGPIIFVLSIIIWGITYFPNSSPKVDTTNLNKTEISQLQRAERLSGSYASHMGRFIQPVMSPIGMDWRVGVSLISAFAAREVFVSSLALIFKVTGNEQSLQSSIVDAMRKAEIGSTGEKLFTPATICGLIVFFMFSLQCISTIAVSRKETGSWRIPILQVIIFTSLGYFMTFITVNGLRAFGIN
ncbi:MAG: ferrous iron transport protein B [Ignavibacteriaceae bacterium]|nr:ferrous iron transport protein B [Ignavibacteriaceae bacterium]